MSDPTLEYAHPPAAMPMWVCVHTWVVIGFGLGCSLGLLLALVNRFFFGIYFSPLQQDGLIGLFLVATLFAAWAAYGQWRGFLRNERRYAIAATHGQGILVTLIAFLGIIFLGDKVARVEGAWSLAVSTGAILLAVALMAFSVYRCNAWARRLPA